MSSLSPPSSPSPLCSKYSPSKIEDLVCNIEQCKKLFIWLKEYNKNRPTKITKKLPSGIFSCLIITGNHGSGKTVSVKTVLKSLNYTIHEIDTSMMGTIEKSIRDIIPNNNIMDMFLSNKRNNKHVILIDELESLTSTNEKNYIRNLLKLNDSEWHCPIIFISNNKHNKLISELIKKCYYIKFDLPKPSELSKIFVKIAISENIKMHNKDTKYIIETLIEHSKNDIRRMINTIQDIKTMYQSKPLTKRLINKYCKLTEKKDLDIDSYKATSNLLFNYKNINNCLRLYEMDKALLPLLVHHNYLDYVLKNSTNNFDLAIKISNSLSLGDIVENYIYCNQRWELQEIHGFYTCIAPSYYLKNGIKDNKKLTPIIYHLDYNKTSIKNINKKIIFKINNYFKDCSIMDYIYINKILRDLLEENNIEKIKTILAHYPGLDSKFDSLLKIDRIYSNKISLTLKQKKEFLTSI